MKKLLTIEYDSEDEILEMHLDKEGAKLLLNKIQMLLEKDENSHEHLMTDTWVEMNSLPKNKICCQILRYLIT
jgi:hypothetical protein